MRRERKRQFKRRPPLRRFSDQDDDEGDDYSLLIGDVPEKNSNSDK